jgi:hypothetical protein
VPIWLCFLASGKSNENCLPFARRGVAFSIYPTDNGFMVIRGRIHNGVVAFGSEISLPEGMEVTVVVPAAPEQAAEVMSEDERRRIRQVMDEIAAMPNENPGDTFSGADHDKVLYGAP